MTKIEAAPSTGLYPVPVVLVTSHDRATGRNNIITLAWCGIVCSEPALVSISIRPSRFSHQLITVEHSFVINIPSQAHLKETDFCGIHSGRDTDKFKRCGFTPAPATKVSAPLIKECPVNLECSLSEIKNLGSHDLFIGKVINVHADTAVVNENGEIDYQKAAPIVFNQGEYWNLGQKVGFYGYSQKA